MKFRFRKRKYIFPDIGRAGLGNELFPYMRAFDQALELQGKLLPPRWLQPRIGPTLRREHDRRQYWKLFQVPSMSEMLERSLVRAIRTVPLIRFLLPGSTVYFIEGMANYFDDLKSSPSVYRDFLYKQARSGVLTERRTGNYFSVHIRLGDFQRTDDNAISLSHNSHATPLTWYVGSVRALRKRFPDIDIVVSSDGTADELSEILRIEGVERSTASNALDEIFLLSNSIGMLGSRSTFTAWGAFLGNVPLLVMHGGNAYYPHCMVWETVASELPEKWIESVAERQLPNSV